MSCYGIRPVGKPFGVVSLRPDELARGLLTSLTGSQSPDDVVEVISRVPAKLIPSLLVNVDPVDRRKHLPAKAFILGLVVRGATPTRHRPIGGADRASPRARRGWSH